MVTNTCRNVHILVTLYNSSGHFTWLSVRISLNIYRSEKYFEQTLRRGKKHAICVRYTIRPDTAYRKETRNLCPVHIRPDTAYRKETRNLCPVHYMPGHRVQERNTQCVRYIIRPDTAYRKEIRNLCPLHFMPGHCVQERNTQFVSGTLYARTLRTGKKYANCVRYILCPDTAYRK